MLRSTLLTLALSHVAAHGAMLTPTSRNAIAPYGLPMKGSAGTNGFQSGNCVGQKQPYPCKYDPNDPATYVSPCGDGGFGGNQYWFYAGGVVPPGIDVQEGPYWKNFRKNNDKTMWTKFTPGEKVEITFTITAYHGGAMGAYLCPWKNDNNDFDPEECGIFANTSAVDSAPNGPRGGCEWCTHAGPWYNYSSKYFLGTVDLKPNWELCAGNCDTSDIEKKDVTLRDGSTMQMALLPPYNINDNRCGYNQPFLNVSEDEKKTMVGAGAGCQGPTNTPTAAGHTPPGSSRFTWPSTNPVPLDFPTTDAVLVWHWITDNSGLGATNTEQFMNCADMTSDKTSPIPSGPWPSPAPSAPPPPPSSPVPTCKDKKCINPGQPTGLCLWQPSTEAECNRYSGYGCEWGCPPSSSASKSSKKSLDQRLEETAHALQAH